jgi:hypothetical protein
MPKASSQSSSSNSNNQSTSKFILTDEQVNKLLTTKLIRYKLLSTQEFINKYLQPPTGIMPNNSLGSLRVEELKDILRFIKGERHINVKLSGNKDELVTRVLNTLYDIQDTSSSSSQSSTTSSQFSDALPFLGTSSKILTTPLQVERYVFVIVSFY